VSGFDTGNADPTRPVRLGPFVLQDPIGRGGMGQVWRGWHHERNVPVAVKVLEATTDDIDRAFRNEVQAVARLDHPGVVWVYDVGQVDEDAARGSRGRLTRSSPYIAMEFATRGTLRDLGRLPWDGVRDVLLALLDALAHAHARAVVHRDLKPANVLVCGPEDLRPGLKLADFGIAHAFEHQPQTAARSKTAIGTVQYMAPEQIRVEHQDTGPWTDIYALGNVTWQMLTGKIPFSQYSGVALVRAQLDEPLPDPVGVRTPDGFVEWLRRCVAKNPVDRFQRCADAAEALLQLGDLKEGGRRAAVFDRLPTVAVEVGDDGTTTSPVTSSHPRDGASQAIPLHTGLVALPVAPSRAAQTSTGSVRRGPTVADWRRADLPRASFQLLGAGLALYDVRQPPMVGRVEERDRLWGELLRVTETQRPGLALVTGPTGVGKSRLIRWLCERAHELGAATVLTAKFFEDDSPDGALRRMWTRHLRMAEVEPAERGKWLVKVLGRLGLPSPEQFAVLVGPGSADKRRVQSEVMLRAMSAERPIIVSLDDVDANPEALAFASHLVRAAAPLPVLVVACARTEMLVDGSAVVGQIEALAADHPHLELGPLPPRDQAALIEEVLGLSPALAAQVLDRTGGNPRFARKLIGDWVKRGVLVLGPTGFEVRRGETLDLPPSLKVEWVERIKRLLHDLPDKAHAQIERAAVLGLEVRLAEWRAACDDPDGSWASAGRSRVVPESERLRTEVVQRLQHARLVQLLPDGFRFVHGMIREVLIDRAKDARRLVEHHLACASALRFVQDREATSERIGRHLQEAGRHEESIEPLLQGVVWRRDRLGARAALGLVALAEDALRALRLPDTDPRWAEAWQLRAMLTAELGDVVEAERLAMRVVQGEGNPGWTASGLDVRLTLARLRAGQGQLDLADRMLIEVEERATDPVQQGLASAERALIAARRRRKQEARDRTDNAIRQLRRAASSRALAECWRVVGVTALILGNERQAEDALQRGLRLYQGRGNLVGQAECLAGLGRSALGRRDLPKAEKNLEQAVHLYDLAGLGDVVRAKCDLARVRLEQGRPDSARELLLHVRQTVGRMGGVARVEGIGALQLLAAAATGEWDEFDHRMRQIEADAAIEVGEDGLWALARAGEVARDAGQHLRGVQAESLQERVPRSSGRVVA
jgi:serine/threonine protein kinase/tetratricopeptide (TPR) repeat protein